MINDQGNVLLIRFSGLAVRVQCTLQDMVLDARYLGSEIIPRDQKIDG